MASAFVRRSAVVLAVMIVGTPPGARRVEAGVAEWWFGQPWAFVESVGGIRVGAATRRPDGRVQLALECNVSGVQSITRTPQTMNSAVGISKVLAAADGHRIAISLRTGI